MNNKNPLISIIVNCYNGEKYLKKSINSIFILIKLHLKKVIKSIF
jgi:hypothetical protein